ncbi:Flp pilus assembly protein, ATPase CpaF [Brachybacterium faecium DSM 4810]|uniref:Flp pilus assembly protein, ATPase CpaF n=1 Tax=Brachybacterium faecium (strain ATCC 43885 / DSM 4810 / JCM 11609 / LMG 19847 / NBRC 14762 / NCIMB 9860 / 6-10) TaxID=446465 RepID=C7ME42_BRAFD|nr:ATPase, T2SS/T4P/T4SS family [Brachybacterium faecium]ACU85849.1 Flp pilus assembly protein, ATPase CpaF [Brachybacterium faecium DSM 4810]HJG53136.1 Flp pilus assembly complex ATPase component TadA [Brachybacterium faecium]
MDAATIIESESRELIRRRGLDVRADQLEPLIREVMSDYDRRSSSGEVPVLRDDDETMVAEVAARIGGFGPLQEMLDDPAIEEIWLNSPSQVFCARNGRSELTTIVLSDTEVRGIVERMLVSSGRRLDMSTPFVDALLPDGSRLHVVIPSVTRAHWAINIRKFVAKAYDLQGLVALGSLTQQAADFLDAAIASGLNVVASGATGAGKTTLLRCLARSVGPRERVVTIEEVFELNLALRDVVAMQTRQANLEGTGEITMRRLVKEALRMRPSRIIVGEVREAESLDMLIALNSGLPGLASIHANSARDAVTKLCTLPLLAGENVSSRFVVPTVASAIDLVVHLDMFADGRRRVREIIGLSGRIEDDIIEISDVFSLRGDRLVRGDGHPPHPDRFVRAGHDLSELLGGVAA